LALDAKREELRDSRRFSMKAYKVGAVAFTATMLLGPGVTLAAEKVGKIDHGMQEYRDNCAVCHGDKGKGDGPYGEFISKIPDLTVLSKNNKGVFPIDRVYGIIDGRQQIKAHGPRDMPIWGERYGIAAAEHYRDVDYDQEAYIRSRVLFLVDYLYRLQVK
jgi:mono/diheme cytochrome c family protein